MNRQPTYNPLELLRRWLRGEARHEEERQLEQLAKEDPFLAEALEGYRRYPEGQHTEQVERLKERLRQKGRKKRGLLFYLPRAAAAAVGLAILAGGFWFINQPGAEQQALVFDNQQAEPEQAEKSAAKTEAPLPTPPLAEKKPNNGSARTEIQSDKSFADVPEKSPGPTEKITSRKKQKEASKPSAPPAQDLQQIAQAQPVPSPVESRGLVSEAEEVELYESDKQKTAIAKELEISRADTEIAQARTAAPPSPAGAAPAAPNMRRVEGTVLDEYGDPLIGANILLEGTSLGTVSDFDGHFRLEWPDSLKGNLVFSYTGYSSQQVSPKEENTLRVVLSEGEALLESVTITGYNTSRQEPPPPRPEEGFQELRQYIRDNLKYPEAARQNGIEGRVVLSFRIRPDGSLYDFNVKKGLGYGCDEEAIRLLQEGPKWEGAGQEVRYSVRFKR